MKSQDRVIVVPSYHYVGLPPKGVIKASIVKRARKETADEVYYQKHVVLERAEKRIRRREEELDAYMRYIRCYLGQR